MSSVNESGHDSASGLVPRLSLLAAPFAVAVAAILSIYFGSGSPLEGTYRAIALALVLVLAVEGILIPFVGLGYAAAVTAVLVLVVFKDKATLGAVGAVSAGVALWSWTRRRPPPAVLIEQAVRLGAAFVLITTIGAGILQGALGLPTIAAKADVDEAGDGSDIILVLLDGYPRSDTLATAFGFDNGPFLEGLEARGFEVAARSRSNYSLTGLTFASMFQMRHIPDIEPLAQETRLAEGWRAISEVLAAPLPALETLRHHGYETIGIPSVVNEMRLRSADRDLDTGQVVQLETVLLGKTLLAPVVNWMAPDFLFDQMRDRSLESIAAVEAVAADTKQQFVFAHLMLPHAPFVFGPNGEPLSQPDCVPVCSIFEPPADHDEWLRLYRDQVKFVNQRMLEMIDAMQAGEADPVIILMSDHGSRGFAAENPDEMLLNFFASATPGVPGLFPEDATPINVFPRLFGAYLDEESDLLPDRFFLPDGDGPTQIKAVE
jgi:hypothetical protein